jgi:hypothetical protein
MFAAAASSKREKMQTRFTHGYLKTNYIPSDLEVQEIKQLLEEPQARLTQLNDELHQMEIAIDVLRQERNKLLDAIDSHRALISYARRIPNELWQEIFIHSLPSERNAVMSCSETPILLGHVCITWRRMALSTPQLWATLHIPLPTRMLFSGPAEKSVHEKVNQRREVAEMWLRRSGDIPLSISLAEPVHGPPVGSNLASLILKSLMVFSQRWKHINFLLSTSSIASLTTLSEEDVPILESFSIRDVTPRTTASGPAGVWDSPAFLRAPRLCTVAFQHMAGDLLGYPLRWSQLTEIWIKDHGRSSSTFSLLLPSTVLEILTRCTNLQLCRLDMAPAVGAPIDNDEALKTVFLPLLTTLSIWETQNLSPFFQRLHVPALRHFEYRSLVPTPSISTFLFEPRPGLESLVLDSRLFTEPLLLECLGSVPTITRLTIARWSGGAIVPLTHYSSSFAFGERVLQHLTPNEGTLKSCLCPKLKVFECYQHDFSDLSLFNFIILRSKLFAGQLMRVHVTFLRDRTFDILPGLSSIVQDGMDISLAYPEPPSYSPWTGLPKRRWLVDS